MEHCYLVDSILRTIEKIGESAESNGLRLEKKLERNNWVGLKYVN